MFRVFREAYFFFYQAVGLWAIFIHCHEAKEGPRASLLSNQPKHSMLSVIFVILLGIFGCVKQLLGFGDVLHGLVDDPIDVGEVGQAVLYLHYHVVQRGPVDRQRDGQDLQRHFLYALRVGSLLWTVEATERCHRAKHRSDQTPQHPALSSPSAGLTLAEVWLNFYNSLKQVQRTSEEISDLLNEIFQFLVVAFKVVLLLLGFLQCVHRLVLNILRQCGYILELDAGEQRHMMFFQSWQVTESHQSSRDTTYLNTFRTFFATPCSSSLAVFRPSATFLAWFRAATEALTVPLQPSPPHTWLPWSSRQPAPPHWLSGQLPFTLALLWPPHTWREQQCIIAHMEMIGSV